MLSLAVILAGAALGWLYIVCRLLSRIAAVADRIIRLAFLGAIVVLLSPVVYLFLLWRMRFLAMGWLNVDWGGLIGLHLAVPVCVGVGWCVVVGEFVRRRIVAAGRMRKIESRVEFIDEKVHNCKRLLPSDHAVWNAVYSITARIPGNTVGVIRARLYALTFPALPVGLDGMRIVHMTDLHFSDAVSPAYFECAVDAANAFDPDVILLTGDYLDSRDPVRRVQSILAGLRAQLGVYFVCGNHDIWHGEEETVNALHELGFVHLAGRIERVNVRDEVLHLAGTERPWKKDRLDTTLDSLPENAFVICLSHHPDNARWLRRHNVELVLSGHTHGGQNALPGLGPLLVPSAHGSAHAGGFVPYNGTLLYINHGIAAHLPSRMLCSPEIVCFELHRMTTKLI